MEQPQNFDLTLIRSDPEQHEMPALVAAARHMQREQPPSYLATLPCPDRRWSVGQCHESRRKGVGIDARLQISELSQRPIDDVLIVSFGRRGKAH